MSLFYFEEQFRLILSQEREFHGSGQVIIGEDRQTENGKRLSGMFVNHGVISLQTDVCGITVNQSFSVE